MCKRKEVEYKFVVANFYKYYFLRQRCVRERSRERMASKPHVLVIPFPVQGHINPMLQFSKRLASKGLNVTLVATCTISKSLKQAQASSITLVTIPDGSENGPQGYDKSLKRFKIVVEQNLFELIERNNNCGQGRIQESFPARADFHYKKKGRQ